MNFEQARHNMVQQQVRTWEVLNNSVLDVLETLPREAFVAPEHRKLAYVDTALPIAHGEVMMKPVVEGRLLQSLDLSDSDHVLEVGTGSGYVTACLAKLAQSVYSIEYYSDLAKQAESRLQKLKLDNTHIETADVYKTFEPAGRYDAVVITGSVRAIPDEFKQWLQVGGRLFIVVGSDPVMEARLVTRVDEDQWVEESLFETVVPPLIGAVPPQKFDF